MSTINVLVVADGNPPHIGFNFAHSDISDDTFTIGAFLDTLRNSTSPVINLTTAHRRNDPAADHPNFNFALTVPDLSAFDVICMLGYEGSNYLGSGPLTFITDDELLALSVFMKKGGGILATGDHDGLGSLMCGRIPRVRSMRKWFSPSDNDPGIPALAPRNWPGAGPERADTLQPDHDGNYHFDNQSDDTPQPLSFPAGNTHPVLQGAHGPLAGFPDHMHEGEVIIPWTLTDTLTFNGQPFPEYPVVGAHQEIPVILATGHVIPGHKTPIEGSSCEQINFYDEETDTTAKTIGILCVYDGHNAGVGRIVTDSSFHHYLDLNLIGDPCGVGYKQQGFTTNAMLADMQAFFINTIVWLDRLVKECTVTTDRSTFGRDEIAAALHSSVPAVIEKAFYVVADGFLHEELNITAGTLTGIPDIIPSVSFNPALSAAPPGQSRVIATNCSVDGGLLLDTPQRFTWTFSFQFFDTSDFTEEVEQILLTASITSVAGVTVSGQGVITLTTQPNPYETDGATSWLSVDLQVFHLPQNGFLPFTPGIQLSGTPNAFITKLLSNTGDGYNNPALARAPSHPFDMDLVANQATSTVEWAGTVPSTTFPFFPVPVYNFAVARVRYRALAIPASNVRVFFRMFQASTTSTEFQPSTTYLTGGMGGSEIPLLGVVNGEVVSIPFFAAPRIDPANPNGLNAQPDPSNTGPVGESIPPDGSGAEVQVYFGCWLDINQNVPALPDPNHPASATGPYTPVQSIQQAIMGKHQCLVAEIRLDPPEPQIATGVTPANSDKLAQRNLTIVGAASPHRIPVTFDIKPTRYPLPVNQKPDELMINWGNLPAGSRASVYLPGTPAATILSMANELYASHDLSAIDPHTLGCKAGGITYLPIPPGIGSNYAGLLTVDLPPTVSRGQHFTVIAQQITNASGKRPVNRQTNIELHRERSKEELKKASADFQYIEWRAVLGSFQLSIPVSVKEALRDPEERLLAVARWVERSLPAGHRWYQVFKRYVDIIAGRVLALGGNPGKILPSPSGYNPGSHSRPGSHNNHPGHHHPGQPHHPGHDHGDQHGQEHRLAFTGKIAGLIFDLFGDFEGFILRTELDEFSFFSREPEIERLAKYAWQDRISITVFTRHHEDHRPISIIFRHGPRPFHPDAGF